MQKGRFLGGGLQRRAERGRIDGKTGPPGRRGTRQEAEKMSVDASGGMDVPDKSRGMGCWFGVMMPTQRPVLFFMIWRY